MGYVNLYVNVLVAFLCVAACVAMTPTPMSEKCKKLMVKCYKQPELDIKALRTGLSAIKKGFAQFTFNFTPIAEKTALDNFCSAWSKWTDCLKDCMNEKFAVWQKLQPVPVICSRRREFLSSPTCWKSNTVMAQMRRCAERVDKHRIDCKSFKKSMTCMKRRFGTRPGCTAVSKRFISAVLDDYMKKDYLGLCKRTP